MSTQNQNEDQQNEMNAANHPLAIDKSDLNFWQEFWSQLRLVWFLFWDREVPVYLKALPVLAVIYAISPIDLIPDVILGLGQLDDLTMLLVGGKVFIELAPPQIVARHLKLMHGSKEELAGAQADSDPEIVDSIVIRPDNE
jgi:uncharacterized membrane protein YkvA (DUF1232 family)